MAASSSFSLVYSQQCAATGWSVRGRPAVSCSPSGSLSVNCTRMTQSEYWFPLFDALSTATDLTEVHLNNSSSRPHSQVSCYSATILIVSKKCLPLQDMRTVKKLAGALAKCIQHTFNLRFLDLSGVFLNAEITKVNF